MQDPIRVLIVDDSATARALLSAMLTHDPGISIVGEADSGEAAVDAAHRLRPSLITMDVHMPGMGGLEATRTIMSIAPTAIVIVSSATTGSAVNLSLDATAAGALTVIAKPEGPAAAEFNARRREFISLIRAMSEVKVVRRWARGTPTESAIQVHPRLPTRTAQIVAIAASTGGPAVLQSVFRKLPRDFALPILVVQHIARGFAGGLASWLADGSPLRVKVAEDGEPLRRGTVYIASEDRHLGVNHGGTVLLSAAPEIGGFRPSASFLFRSVARVYSSRVAAVILTGMGRDGVDGLADVSREGGQVIAQDKESCVVYGMPQEAVRSGVVDTIVPASQLGAYLGRISQRRSA